MHVGKEKGNPDGQYRAACQQRPVGDPLPVEKEGQQYPCRQQSGSGNAQRGQKGYMIRQ